MPTMVRLNLLLTICNWLLVTLICVPEYMKYILHLIYMYFKRNIYLCTLLSGPDMWATDYPGCAGENQSPINIVEDEAKYKDLTVVLEGYSTAIQYDISNNGHTSKK